VISDREQAVHVAESATTWFGRRRTAAKGVAGLRYSALLAVGVTLVLAFSLRVAVYLDAPRPFDGAGLAAEQGEIARHIVNDGRWFVINDKALELVEKRQTAQQQLVDPASVDFSAVDRKSSPAPEVDQMPGVAVVLAGLWWTTGKQTYAQIQWLQILLDTAMVFLVFWIALRLARSTRVALLAALFYALWPGAIIVAKRPVLDTWAGFFTIGCVAAFVWARDQPSSRWRLVLLGLLTGAGIYFRPFVLLLPIALALVATPGGGWRRRLLWMSAPTLVALLVLAPWTIRNYYAFDRFIPTRTGLGQAVFEGTGQAKTDTHAEEYVQRHRKNAKYGSPAYDDFLLSGAVRAIADNPGFYLRLVGHRARLLLPCLLVLLLWRRWGRAALIPVAAAATTIVPFLLIGDDTRFYLPAAFAYAILGAMTVEVVVSRAARRTRWTASAGTSDSRKRG
jgi:4-amino-4-deoxy-L-arabinose transferase-like glycosyltransferase